MILVTANFSHSIWCYELHHLVLNRRNSSKDGLGGSSNHSILSRWDICKYELNHMASRLWSVFEDKWKLDHLRNRDDMPRDSYHEPFFMFRIVIIDAHLVKGAEGENVATASIAYKEPPYLYASEVHCQDDC